MLANPRGLTDLYYNIFGTVDIDNKIKFFLYIYIFF